jgi:hypothetical protein
LWESSAFPAVGREPQLLINEQIVHDADILVGAFWTRLGTPTGRSPSGTVEEIDQVVTAGKPVLLYFSQQPVDPGSVDTEQLAEVHKFRDEMKAKSLYATYDSPEDLERHLVGDLTRAVRKMVEEGLDVPAVAAPTPARSESGALSAGQEFGRPVRQQLKGVLARTRSEWTTLAEGSDVEGARYLMADLAQRLSAALEEVVAATDGADTSVTQQLTFLSQRASQLSRHQFYRDGGRSWNEFVAGVRDVLGGLESLLGKSWDLDLGT